MKRQWKSIALAILSALGSALLAALARLDEKERSDQGANQRSAARATPRPAGARDALGGAAVSFLSDVLAETYRKVRSQGGNHRR